MPLSRIWTLNEYPHPLGRPVEKDPLTGKFLPARDPLAEVAQAEGHPVTRPANPPKKRAGVNFRQRALRMNLWVGEHPDATLDQVLKASQQVEKLLAKRAPLKARNRAAKAKSKDLFGE